MAKVSNETDFRSALNRLDPLIEITSDFSLSSQVLISYKVTVTSLDENHAFTLMGANPFGGYLLHIAGGSLTLKNIVVNGGGSPLLFASDGGLVLGEGAVLKNTSVITSPERESIDELYIADSDSIVRIEAPLSPGMVLQVNNSEYVAPNAEGAPIVIGAASPDIQLSQSDADVFKKPRTGFDGWEIRLGDDRRQILLAPEVYSICYDDPLYAFNPNPETYTVTSGSIELVAPGHAEGYQFSGWYDQPEGGRLVTEIPSGSTGDIVLYARWLVTDSYTVTFDANSGPSFPRVCQMPQPLSVVPGGGFIVPSQLPRRTCYRFIEWNTCPQGNGFSCKPGEIIDNVGGNLTLYAIWALGWSWDLV